MSELLCHLFGDYVLQNHWMANTKTRSWTAAILHAFLYTLPFVLLTQDDVALLVIGWTHAFIDRFRLAKYWCDFWGVGCEGKFTAWLMRKRGFTRYEVDAKPGTFVWVRGTGHDTVVVESTADAPLWLGVWLLILVDNTAHLTINHLVLYYL